MPTEAFIPFGNENRCIRRGEFHEPHAGSNQGVAELRPPKLPEISQNWYYTLAVLAWNLIQALKLLHLPVTEAPKRMRMLLRHLLLIPVELKRPAQQLKACLYAPAGWVAW